MTKLDVIKQIRPDKPVPFVLSHPKEGKSLRSLASHLNTDYPELEHTYHVTVDKKKLVAIISAKPKEVER